MSKLIFTPQDFRTSPENPFYDSSLISIECIVKKANKLFNDWLAREGTVVYDYGCGTWGPNPHRTQNKAVLLNIETLEKKESPSLCSGGGGHEQSEEYLYRGTGPLLEQKQYFTNICKHCSKRLQPKGGWEEA